MIRAPDAGDPRIPASLLLLRGSVALIFMAHAVVRLVNGSVPRFAAFLELQGFVHGVAWVLSISACEIVCGGLLVLGLAIRWACAALACIVVTGIVLIHARLGGFVGEHGTGGMEFSVLLCAALLVIASDTGGRANVGARPDTGQAQR